MSVLVDEGARSLLRAVPYFGDLDEGALEAVAHEIIVRHYTAGELIFLEGEPAAGLHLVAEGLCL